MIHEEVIGNWIFPVHNYMCLTLRGRGSLLYQNHTELQALEVHAHSLPITTMRLVITMIEIPRPPTTSVNSQFNYTCCVDIIVIIIIIIIIIL